MLRGLPLILSLATPAVASDLLLDWPMDCTLGEDCYIQQYVDHDPGPGAQDFTCGSLSYDGHSGTDIALPTLAAMEAGVRVLAAASGTVVGVRDEMPDQILTAENRDSIKGRECGNRVAIRHGDGWITQYCHLKRGSVLVQDGTYVEAGTPLALVGLSGATQFPHLHISLRKGRELRDPFTPALDPNAANTCGAAGPETHWSQPVPYVPGGFVAAGFADHIPDYGAVTAGTADQSPLPKDAPALVFWAMAYGARAGDRMELSILDPDNTPVFHTEVPLEKTQARLFRAGGIRLHEPLRPGRYAGQARLIRKGKVVSDMSHDMQVN